MARRIIRCFHGDTGARSRAFVTGLFVALEPMPFQMVPAAVAGYFDVRTGWRWL